MPACSVLSQNQETISTVCRAVSRLHPVSTCILSLQPLAFLLLLVHKGMWQCGSSSHASKWPIHKVTVMELRHRHQQARTLCSSLWIVSKVTQTTPEPDADTVQAPLPLSSVSECLAHGAVRSPMGGTQQEAHLHYLKICSPQIITDELTTFAPDSQQTMFCWKVQTLNRFQIWVYFERHDTTMTKWKTRPSKRYSKLRRRTKGRSDMSPCVKKGQEGQTGRGGDCEL